MVFKNRKRLILGLLIALIGFLFIATFLFRGKFKNPTQVASGTQAAPTATVSNQITATTVFQTDVPEETYMITVNTGTSTGAIKYGGIGWLYGLGENDFIPDAKITALVHPGYSGQKAPGGTQHAYGDVLLVAAQAKRVGMPGVDIYVQDYYAEWPYPNKRVDSYITNVVDKVIDYVKADPNRSFMRYVPFNEPNWIW